MALNKQQLYSDIYNGFVAIFNERAEAATNGDENADPKEIIKQVCADMATCVSDAVEIYVKSGEIKISSANLTVTAPNGACTVTPTTPAKVE